MSENPFKVGDVVQLKSGGPRMTVTAAAKDTAGVDCVWCSWFIGNTQQSGVWPVDAVREAVFPPHFRAAPHNRF
jgi:uncharacterized protein YodC (DUF2158 family)